MSGCLRLLLLINLSSSSFDNYNNDYIIKWPMGNIRFENCRFSFLLVRIYTHILIVVSSGLCLKVRTKVKRKIDWSLDEGCFFSVHKWPFFSNSRHKCVFRHVLFLPFIFFSPSYNAKSSLRKKHAFRSIEFDDKLLCVLLMMIIISH